MSQNSLEFVNFCRHCGGEPVEQWRMLPPSKVLVRDEMRVYVFMCTQCTYETYPDIDRESALETWNLGYYRYSSDSEWLKNQGQGWAKPLANAFEYHWYFEIRYMKRHRPRLRNSYHWSSPQPTLTRLFPEEMLRRD